jgi:similar to spore coat protein
VENTEVSLRESLDLHEIIMFKVLCGTKSFTMKGLVNDEELKGLLEQDFNMTKEHLKELTNLVKTSALNDANNI